MKALIDNIRNDGSPSFDQLADAMRETFPAFDQMSSTPQDERWHAEGDVWTHTGMVVDEVYRAIDEHDRPLTADERLALVLGAALHDIAKPFTTTTREIDGVLRTIAPRHADRGRSYIAYDLRALGLDWATVDRVMALVGHHHDPKQLVTGDRGQRHYTQLARHADTELLYLLELGDVRGRICDDQQEQLDIVELFGMQCQEFGLWQVDDPYASWRSELTAALEDHPQQVQDFVAASAIRAFEAGDIVMPAEEVARSYGYRDAFSHLIVLCGPSGSGKSTWVAEHAADYDRVCLDDLRFELTKSRTDQSKNGEVRQLSKERLKESLRANRNVVWDATNLRKDFRSLPIRLGYDYGAFVTIVAFQPDRDTAAERNNRRDRTVPADILARQFDTAEFPYRWEAHELRVVR